MDSIKDIIERYEDSLKMYQEKEKGYIDTMEFCHKHKFEEESRIANIKYMASSQILFNLKGIINDLKDLKNDSK